MPSFVLLAEVHEQLLELLLCHQEAVVVGDVEEARARFSTFAAAQLAHRRVEDELLLPHYAGLREAIRPGGALGILEAEHRKLGKLVVVLQQELGDLDASRPIPVRERIRLIESERVLKELFDHHDQRERAALFPALDRAFGTVADDEELWKEIVRRHGNVGLRLRV